MTLAMSWEEWAQHDFTQLWARPPRHPNGANRLPNRLIKIRLLVSSAPRVT